MNLGEMSVVVEDKYYTISWGILFYVNYMWYLIHHDQYMHCGILDFPIYTRCFAERFCLLSKLEH